MNEINIKENANIKDDPGEAYLESIVDTVKTESENMNNKQSKNQPNDHECKEHAHERRKMSGK